MHEFSVATINGILRSGEISKSRLSASHFPTQADLRPVSGLGLSESTARLPPIQLMKNICRSYRLGGAHLGTTVPALVAGLIVLVTVELP